MRRKVWYQGRKIRSRPELSIKYVSFSPSLRQLPDGETAVRVSTQVAHQTARTVETASDETKPLSDAVVCLMKSSTPACVHAGFEMRPWSNMKLGYQAIRKVVGLPCIIREAGSYANVDKTMRTRADGGR